MRVVLDANVVVSALIRPEGPPGVIVDRFVRGNAFEVATSTEIMDETRRALAYPKVKKIIRPGVDAAAWLEALAFLAVLVEPRTPAPRVCRDADDDIYFAAALAASADYIVSGDPDVLAVTDYQGIVVLTPRAFLSLLEGST